MKVKIGDSAYILKDGVVRKVENVVGDMVYLSGLTDPVKEGMVLKHPFNITNRTVFLRDTQGEIRGVVHSCFYGRVIGFEVIFEDLLGKSCWVAYDPLGGGTKRVVHIRECEIVDVPPELNFGDWPSIEARMDEDGELQWCLVGYTEGACTYKLKDLDNFIQEFKKDHTLDLF